MTPEQESDKEEFLLGQDVFMEKYKKLEELP